MNRAERRKRAKLGLPVSNEPVYNVKHSDFVKQKEQAKSEAVDAAMVLLFAIPIKVMREEFGWGIKSRLPRLAEALTDEYQRFADGEMSLEEYSEYVYETVGIKFKQNDE